MAVMTRLAGGVLLLLAASPPSPFSAGPGRASPSRHAWTGATAGPDSVERQLALHVLNRLTYGPRPGDVDRVLAMGVDRFIAQQLHPETLNDDALRPWLAGYEVLRMSPQDLAQVVLQAQQARRARQLSVAADSQMDPAAGDPEGGRRGPRPPNRARRLAGELQEAAVVRAALSQRQLYEVMVDFWTNHFNVFLGKGADRFLLPDFIEHTIRPHAMGTFPDLLIATAESPAMLFYLDNAESVAPGSTPPQLAQLDQRLQRGGMRQGPFGRRFGRFGRQPDPAHLDSLRRRMEQRLPKGINENYGRELMELHTLGVDGGYTQQDVIAVARILTGWSIRPPRQGGGFVFNSWAHDEGAKVVLGHAFPAGHGMDEGIALLKMLAMHPATMRHVSSELCAKFVADDPPEGCIDAAVAAWQRTGGDIPEVLDAIFHSPEFRAPENANNKFKTPLEFVVSAVRATGSEPDSTLALAQIVGRLGEPLYLDQPPTGYPESQASWVNSGALLQRFNVALGMAAGRAPGVTVSVDDLIPEGTDPATLAEAVNRVILHGTASANTLKVIREQTADLGPRQARVMAVGLALGSPEFQRQ
jgi:uncharacterized protein (DUF1800 family)